MKVLVILAIAVLSGKLKISGFFKKKKKTFIANLVLCEIDQRLYFIFIHFILDCQAHQLYGDESKAQVEVLIDSFWNYIAKATQTADDSLQMIRESQFGQEVKWVL